MSGPGGTPIPQVAGFSPVAVGATGAALTAMSYLGYTRNGAQVQSQGFFEDIPGDQYGGESGPPVDIQYMGEIAIVRLMLTKFDWTVLETVMPRLAGGTAGVPGVAGSLLFGGSYTYRVLIQSTIGPVFNFPVCVPREPYELNRGTKFSELAFVFTAYAVPGTSLLWNTTAT
ncbi:MAG: hypothetical protein KGL39_37250 [Patescibacteria group bacterium]|nr:hypothetical protein [Patescibacteria group bacterium]